MTLHFELIESNQVPLEVEGVTPEATRGLSLAEVERLSLFHGNQEAPIGEYFRVRGEPGSDRHHWSGGLAGVHWLGAHLREGEIVIEGPVGRHVGSEMKGGRIEVRGDVSDWVGAEMKGGEILVTGRAGHLVGAAYRGSPSGMKGGVLQVRGDAGNEIGLSMRRGVIAIGGSVGDLLGFNMRAGTIWVSGESGIRHGAGMKRGTIVFAGDSPPPLLPSFKFACRRSPEVLGMLTRHLARHEFPLPDSVRETDFELYHGDMIEGGRGEMFLRGR